MSNGQMKKNLQHPENRDEIRGIAEWLDFWHSQLKTNKKKMSFVCLFFNTFDI